MNMVDGLDRLLADAVLPDQIRPRAASTDSHPQVAMVTGACGFLGRYVVLELLKTTKMRLHLLVRRKPNESATDRTNRVFSELDVTPEVFLQRCKVISGDLTEDFLGLGKERYQTLSQQVDILYLCAAAVDWVRDYRHLKRVNVDGVRRMIQFACLAKTKRIVFVSSLAVCFAHGRTAHVDEYTDMLPHIDGMPLGYARTKCVSEALLKQAADRGLPVTVVRPPLIAGHSMSGLSKSDDIFAAILQGCIASGLAMDTEWVLDVLPVDYVARVIAQVPQGSFSWQPLNLRHQDSRTWKQLVVWINLHGYPVKFVSDEVWIDNLFDQHKARGKMIYAQRQFFSGRGPRAGECGKVRPFETYLPKRQALIQCEATQALLLELGIDQPPIDTQLLHTYFKYFREIGVLPVRTVPEHQVVNLKSILEGNWTSMLAAGDGKSWLNAECIPIGGETGISSDILASRVKDCAGVWHLKKTTYTGSDADRKTHAVLKVRSHSRFTREQSAMIAALCRPELGALFRQFSSVFGLTNCHETELSIHELRDATLGSFMPACFGTFRDLKNERWAMLIEYLPEVRNCEKHAWIDANDPKMNLILDGLAEIHAAWFGREEELATRLSFRSVSTVNQMIAATPLWMEFADFTGSRFEEWCGPDIRLAQIRIIEQLEHWWPRYASLPSTLIHNDFNPRNYVLRKDRDDQRLCAFDWELATIGAPQRDLVELLCFTWHDELPQHYLDEYLDKYRVLLSTASGKAIDEQEWRQGVSFALRHLLISRLSLYAIMDTYSPLEFFPTIMKNWMHLSSCLDPLLSNVRGN